jgi:hypothetical protein
MEKLTLPELFQEYAEKRNINITYEQFVSFVAFYPSLLIIASDELVDEEEWEYVYKLSESLVSLFVHKIQPETAEMLKTIFKNEYKYLLGSFEVWEGKFLIALKDHLKKNPHDKFEVVGAMYLFAEASNAIDDKEQQMIARLKKELELNDIG